MSELIVKLSAIERSKYSNCKDTIKSGLKSFIEVGDALLELRESKLYREEYGTFEECCDIEFGISRPRAYQFMASSDVAGNLSTMVDKASLNERQLRPLTSVPAEKQGEVFQAAKDKAEREGRKVTAKDVKAAVVASKPPPPPKKREFPKDDKGKEIPNALIPLWNRRGEVKVMINSLNEIKRNLKRSWEDKDPLYAGGSVGRAPLNYQSVEAKLEMAIADLKAAYPVRVCPSCHGDTCRACCGLGLISDFYLSTIPESIRGK